jgi:hypothetical protein
VETSDVQILPLIAARAKLKLPSRDDFIVPSFPDIGL